MAATWQRDYQRYKKYFLDIAKYYQKHIELKLFVELLLSLGAISVFALFAIKPTVVTIIDLVKQIQEKQETSALMDQKIRNLQIAQNLLREQRQNVDILKIAVPDSPEPQRYVQQVVQLALENNVAITGISIEDTLITGTEEKKSKSKKQVLGTEVSIGGQSDFKSIKKFLLDIERLRTPISLTTTKLALKENEQGETLIQLAIKGILPYLKEEDAEN